MELRLARPSEYAAAGRVIVEAYAVLPGGQLSDDYAAELADVRRRAEEAEVYVAVDEDGDVIGSITLVPDATSPWAELLEADEAGIRMLAVRPMAQGRGLGRALLDVAVRRAADLGRTAVVLHTTPWMPAAQRLYERAGFQRFPERDWTPAPDVPLLAYRLALPAAPLRPDPTAGNLPP